MPYGKGTYGSKVGRPSKAAKKDPKLKKAAGALQISWWGIIMAYIAALEWLQASYDGNNIL